MKKILIILVLLCTCLSVYAEENTPKMILAKHKNILPYTKQNKCFLYYMTIFFIKDYKVLETKDYTITKRVNKELEDLFVNKLGGNFEGLKNNDGSIDDDTIALYISYLKDHSNVSPLKRDIAHSLANLGYREGHIQNFYLKKLLVEKGIFKKDKDFIDKISNYYTILAHREIKLVDDLGEQSDLLEKYPIKIKDSGIKEDIIIDTISNSSYDTLQVILKANDDYKKQMIELVVDNEEDIKISGSFYVHELAFAHDNDKILTALDNDNFKINFLTLKDTAEIFLMNENTSLLFNKEEISDILLKVYDIREDFLDCYIPDFDKIINEPKTEKK